MLSENNESRIKYKLNINNKKKKIFLNNLKLYVLIEQYIKKKIPITDTIRSEKNGPLTIANGSNINNRLIVFGICLKKKLFFIIIFFYFFPNIYN